MASEARLGESDLWFLPIERRLDEALKRLDARAAEAQGPADDAAVPAAGIERRIEERVRRVLEAERRLAALLDEITATAQRIHAADQRAMLALQGLVMQNSHGNGRPAPQAAD